MMMRKTPRLKVCQQVSPVKGLKRLLLPADPAALLLGNVLVIPEASNLA